MNLRTNMHGMCAVQGHLSASAVAADNRVRTFKSFQDEALVFFIVSNVIIEAQVILMTHRQPAAAYILQAVHAFQHAGTCMFYEGVLAQ